MTNKPKITKTTEGRTLVNGIELQYISGSSLPFFKLKHKDKKIQKENFDDFKGLLKYTNKHLKGYFTLGTLYNAYQEKNDGVLLEKDNLGYNFILSDSGGLQQARRGEKFSEEVKRDIYLHQAQYSDLAMNFDEMPFKTIEANAETGVNLMASRCYIREMVKDTAILSADEVRKQIEVFNTIEARAKISPIIHGFRPQTPYFRGKGDNTYIEYAKEMIGRIDNSDGHVGGLSFGSNTVSADNRISILKLLQFVPHTLWSKDIPKEYLEHIHMLGVASPQRLMTILSMVRANIIDKRVKKISFDSTALTKAYTVGKVHKNRYEFENDTPMRPELTMKHFQDPNAKNIRHYYQQVYGHFKDYSGYMFDSWEDLAIHSYNNGATDVNDDGKKISKKFAKQVEEHGGVGSDFHRKWLQGVRLCGMYVQWCYIEAMEDYIDGRRVPEDFTYGTEMDKIYHSIERDITDADTLYDVVEMHLYKVKSNMDFGVDTYKEFDEVSKQLMTIHDEGHQESNTLFEDSAVEKLEKAHEAQKKRALQTRDNNNFIRRGKKVCKDEHIIAKKNTGVLF